MPLWPCFWNVRRVPSSLASRCDELVLRFAELLGPRSGRSSLLSSGLGSNVSRWLGPPAMNRKMTDLALAGMMGRLAASGLAAVDEPARTALASCSLEQRGQGQPAEAAERVADELAARTGRAQ